MKKIMLKIIGKQLNKEGEQEVVELITEGKYYKKGDATYLIYQETELSGVQGCTTKLRITDDIIHMKRFGSASSEIQFQKGKRFNAHYNTPYGNVEMEVLTKKIENELNKTEATGFLNIEYDISLSGLVEGRNKLNIEIMNKAKTN